MKGQQAFECICKTYMYTQSHFLPAKTKCWPHGLADPLTKPLWSYLFVVVHVRLVECKLQFNTCNLDNLSQTRSSSRLQSTHSRMGVTLTSCPVTYTHACTGTSKELDNSSTNCTQWPCQNGTATVIFWAHHDGQGVSEAAAVCVYNTLTEAWALDCLPTKHFGCKPTNIGAQNLGIRTLWDRHSRSFGRGRGVFRPDRGF